MRWRDVACGMDDGRRHHTKEEATTIEPRLEAIRRHFSRRCTQTHTCIGIYHIPVWKLKPTTLIHPHACTHPIPPIETNTYIMHIPPIKNKQTYLFGPCFPLQPRVRRLEALCQLPQQLHEGGAGLVVFGPFSGGFVAECSAQIRCEGRNFFPFWLIRT